MAKPWMDPDATRQWWWEVHERWLERSEQGTMTFGFGDYADRRAHWQGISLPRLPLPPLPPPLASPSEPKRKIQDKEGIPSTSSGTNVEEQRKIPDKEGIPSTSSGNGTNVEDQRKIPDKEGIPSTSSGNGTNVGKKRKIHGGTKD